MSEQSLITRFFDRSCSHSSVILGIGDDTALTTLTADQLLVSTVDTLVAGVHFPDDTAPADIGYKALAVSLSDIAAMAAEPTTALLALTLPHANETWLQAFSNGFFELIEHYHMALIGGDLTKGPLSITTVVQGEVPPHQALQRCGASPGDLIYVTGQLGDAAMALRPNPDEECLLRLNRPTPRIEVGMALRHVASAAIDLSDGLAIDLERLCQASHVGAQVNVDHVPRRRAPVEIALAAGDDFELCFTVPPAHQNKLKQALSPLACPYHCIGHIQPTQGIEWLRKNNTKMKLTQKGYEHF